MKLIKKIKNIQFILWVICIIIPLTWFYVVNQWHLNRFAVIGLFIGYLIIELGILKLIALRKKVDLFSWLYSSFLLRRLLRMLATILFIVTLTFFMIRLMPGNPIDIYIQNQIVSTGMSYQEARDMAAALYQIPLDKPLWEQWIDYLWNMSHGDFGKSYISPGTPVTRFITEYLPWTLFSVGTGILISFIMGTILGMYIAYNRGGFWDTCLSFLSSIMTSIPNYLLGILLLIILGVHLRIIPVNLMRGTSTPGIPPGFSYSYILGIFGHAILPIVTYILSTMGGWILTMKNTTLNTLGEDYVQVAKARGLPESRIIFNYVGRNAILPLFTTLVMQLGLLMGGSPLIETIFVYKGIGWSMGTALSQRDYPVMQAIFLVITVTVIFANFLADLLYSKLDPRIKTNVSE